MKMNINCDIVYDNEAKSYLSGTSVTAQVHLTFNAPTKCRCIYVKFIGESNVKWTKRRHRKGRRGRKEEINTDFTAHEDYFSINRDVIRSEDGTEMELEPKRYTNTVSCTLPHNLPSSFAGPYGAVRYSIHVYVDTAGKVDEIFESEFKVWTMLDLNVFPHLMQPRSLEMTKDFCCWIWRNGPLNICAFLPCTGFTPNSQIPIKIECENGSSVDLSAVKVYIKQIASFHCNEPKRETRVDEQQLCETKLDGVPKHTTKTVEGVLVIPDIKSTNLTSCACIEIKHVLKMKGVTTGANANLFNEVPIVLGTVPFSNFNYNSNEMNMATGSSNAGTIVGRTTEDRNANINNEKEQAPPPSYSDVVNTTSSVEIGWNSNMSS
uniref:CSON013890 protein n=1 Tax=Culicoides sonorensis TaxID=179676 RepID=A0A336M902_CULSO